MSRYLIVLITLLFIPSLVSAQTAPELKIFSADGVLESSFYPLADSYQGNISLEAADLDGDGIAEIIIGYGGGNQPKIEVWRAGGAKAFEYFPYDEKLSGGVFISAGDLDGDGRDEIIAGSGNLSSPRIKGFDIDLRAKKEKKIFDSAVFGESGNQGVRVEAADINGDGKAEVIAASNFNQPAEIAVFDGTGEKLAGRKIDYLNNQGINLSRTDIDGDGAEELAATGGYGSDSFIFFYNRRLMAVFGFFGPKDGYQGGLNLSAGDVTGDKLPEIIITQSYLGGGQIKIYNKNGKLINEFTAFSGEFASGLVTAVADFDGDGRQEIAVLPERINVDAKSDQYKFITVDLASQTLSTWQNGYKIDNYLISSGTKRTPTPTGTFSVFLKRPKVRMSWYYGPDNPMNYDLPNVPWVVSFNGSYTIHGTYWHHNFGYPMSHGCVNMYTPDAKVVYDWADLETPVVIY